MFAIYKEYLGSFVADMYIYCIDKYNTCNVDYIYVDVNSIYYPPNTWTMNTFP